MLYLVRGLPGSGKSTYAKQHSNGGCHYEADDYWIDCRFDPRLLPVAHAHCLLATEWALRLNEPVWVSNTFTTLAEMKPYLDMAAALSVPIKVYKCVGAWKSIHNVPASTLDAMRVRWEGFDGEEEVNG